MHAFADDMSFEAVAASLYSAVQCIRLAARIDTNMGDIIARKTFSLRVLDL